MDTRYGINPQKFYSDSDLDKLGQEHGFASSRSQRDRLRKRGLFPRPVKLSPGRNATLGQHIIEMIEIRLAEVAALAMQKAASDG